VSESTKLPQTHGYTFIDPPDLTMIDSLADKFLDKSETNWGKSVAITWALKIKI